MQKVHETAGYQGGLVKNQNHNKALLASNTHLFGGCDTKSAIYNIGKSAILNLIQTSKEARDLADVFMDPASSQLEIGQAGVGLFVLLYKGRTSDTLADLRYIFYMKMIASAQKIDPSNLPPTEDTATQHSIRGYLQRVVSQTRKDGSSDDNEGMFSNLSLNYICQWGKDFCA